nr:MFS transporter [Mangrovicoccus sp. HB161399]
MPGLLPWPLFAAFLSVAGLPIYLHAPKFYVDSYGVPLAALGAVLAGLRIVDLVQDPVLGWLSDRLGRRRGIAVAAAAGVLAAAMAGLFAVAPPVAPLLWFAAMLTLMFSAWSFLTVSFYAEGVARAERLPGGHLRLAAWRETGTLAGVCLAAMAPLLLGFAGFALGTAMLAAAAVFSMRREWTGLRPAADGAGIRGLLADPEARRLLLLVFVDLLPLAVTSTLFLFFADYRLGAPEAAGPLLLLFFAAAALAAPVWGRLAERLGTRPVLMAAMALAVASFAAVPLLGEGDAVPFAVICVASGAALAADLTLLPALFSACLARIAPAAGQGFGLWGAISKAAMALAALVLLPVLDRAGLQEGRTGAPLLLALLYGLLPLGLKLAAMALLAATPLEERKLPCPSS